MSPFDDLLNHATHPLRIDPELQQEIRHELLTHLEDSAAEYQSAGASEQEAAEQAIKSFGDADQLASQLLSANRRRIRFRQVAKWTMRAVLPPAAAVIAVSLAWEALLSVMAIQMMGYATRQSPPPWATHLWDHSQSQVLHQLSSADRLIFESQGRNSLANARELVQRWPNNPIYQANYTAQASLLISPRLPLQSLDLTPSDEKLVHRVLAIMDQGEAVEPNNGYYNLMKAAVLFNASVRRLTDSASSPGFHYINYAGTRQQMTFSRLLILQPQWFADALTQFAQAAQKPIITSHTAGFAAKRIELLPKPRRLGDQWIHMLFANSVPLTNLSQYQRVKEIVGDHVISLAEKGQVDAALALVANERAVAKRIAASAHWRAQLLVMTNWLFEMRGEEAMIYKIAGRTRDFKEITQHLDKTWRQRMRILRTTDSRQLVPQAAGLDRMLIFDNANPAQLDLATGRKAEYAVADQAAVAVLVILLLLAGMTFEVAPLLAGWWRRERPLYIFVGWKRLGRVALLGGVLPILLYGVYAWLIPAARRDSLFVTLPRTWVEYTFLATVIFILLDRLGGKAVRARMRELGLPVADHQKRWPTRFYAALGILLLLAFVAYEIHWHILARHLLAGSPFEIFIGWPGALTVAGALTIYALPWLFHPAAPQAGGELFWKHLRSTGEWMLVGIVIVLAAFTLYLFASFGVVQTPLLLVAMLVIALAAGFKFIHMCRTRPTQPTPRPAGMFPITLAVALLLGLGAGGFLRWQEHRAVGQMPSIAVRELNQIAGTPLEPLQQQLMHE